LIKGAARAELDPQIMEFVSKHACGEMPLVNLCLGIRNEIGEVYRSILADGVIEMHRVGKFLVSLGCIEEIDDDCDLMFRVPVRTR
jgi:hypothetical protein